MNQDGPADAVGIPSDQLPVWVRARATELVGRTISDRYRIDEVLAVGGMGAVYRGEHIHMRKRVAIKVLHPATRGFAELAMRFEREAVAGAHLKHPNVVSATDFGKLPDGSYFLVLEYVRGATLHSLIRRGPVAAWRALRIAGQIAAALGAGHEMGVIHRDVKPRNVMLVEGEEGVVKLIDYGLAKVPVERLATVDANDPLGKRVITGMGVVFGTVAYMAPETAFGMDAVDSRSDLYALGIILYEMLTGLHPFEADDPGELFLKQRTQRPPSFQQRAPGVRVPPDVEAVVMRMLAKIPEARYQTAREVIAALDAATPIESPITAGDRAPLSVAVAGTIPFALPSSEPPSGPASPRMPSIPGPAKLPTISSAPPPAIDGRLLVSTRPSAPAKHVRWILVAIPIAALLLCSTLLYVMMRRGHAHDAATLGARIGAFARQRASMAAAANRSIDGRDAADWRAQLADAVDARDGKRAAKAIVALVSLDPDAFRDRDVFAATTSALTRMPIDAGEVAEATFDAVATGTATTGPDLLYDIVSGRGGTKAAGLAEDRLRRKDVLERGTPALRIAWGLRQAACEEKPAWFDRAGAEGDTRALAILELLRSSRCNTRIGQCCFHRNGLLDEAIRTLRARLRKQPP